MAKLDVFDFDINKLLNRMKKKHIRPIMCQPHPTLNGIPVMVNSKGEHSLPVAPENGLPPFSGPATDSFGAADGAAFSGSLGDAGGAVSMGESFSPEELYKNIKTELESTKDKEPENVKKMLERIPFPDKFSDISAYVERVVKTVGMFRNRYKLLEKIGVSTINKNNLKKIKENIEKIVKGILSIKDHSEYENLGIQEIKDVVEQAKSFINEYIKGFINILKSVCGIYTLSFRVVNKENSSDIWLGLFDNGFEKLVDNYNKRTEKSKDDLFTKYLYGAVKNIIKQNPERDRKGYETKRNLYYSTIERLRHDGNLNPTDEAIIEESKLHLFDENNKDLVNAIKEKVGDVDDSKIKEIINALEQKPYKYEDSTEGIVLNKSDFNGNNLYDSGNNNKPLTEEDIRKIKEYYDVFDPISLDASIQAGRDDDKEITLGDTIEDNTEEERKNKEDVSDMLSTVKNSNLSNTEKEIFKQYMGFDEEGNKIEGKSIADIAKNNGYTRFHTQEIISDINAKLRLARSAE